MPNVNTKSMTPLSVKEKIAYGLGDTASNIIFQTVMMFLLLFYTDIVGISPAVVGTMFLAVRIIDAITDPLMGNFADKTTSKWGQYRPYLLWLALPFALISILTFTTPQFTGVAKISYAFVTYSLLMIAYTAINIPYCALGGVLTPNAKERVSIQSYRFVFGMLGGVIVAAGTMPLVALLGNGDNAKGYQLTMMVMSTVGFILFLLCFLGTKERISTSAEKSASFKQSISLLWKNDQWRILCMAALFLLTGQVLRLTLAVYYVKYYLGREDLITLFLTLGLIASMVGSGLAQFLVKYVCKIKAYIALQLLAAIICSLSFFIAKDHLILAFSAFIAWKFCLDMGSPLLWAKMTDTIDYGHHKTGVRITGMIFSGVIFFIKMGIAIGGALAGWLLSYYGYHAAIDDNINEQSAITQHGILLSFSVFPAIGSLLVAWLMTKYTLTETKITDIQKSLHVSTN
jgi:GPH family glycoside/pentoside/hexuronide:cation symporter